MAENALHYRIVREGDERLFQQAARLHMEALSYRSFITSFGENFLGHLYRGILRFELGFFVVACRDSELAGFILGAFDGSRLMSVLVRQFYVFIPIMLPVIFRHPSSIRKMIQILFYSGKMPSTLKPELVVIAVDEKCRSQGVGSKMMTLLDEEFSRNHIQEYKVTVHKDMKRSNDFYLSNDFKLIGTFELLNFLWNVYSRKIVYRKL